MLGIQQIVKMQHNLDRQQKKANVQRKIVPQCLAVGKIFFTQYLIIWPLDLVNLIIESLKKNKACFENFAKKMMRQREKNVLPGKDTKYGGGAH